MSRTRSGETSPEAIRLLKEYYLSSFCTYKDLATLSESICSQKIAYTNLIEYIRFDPEGDWEVTRNSLQFANRDDVTQEVNDIRKIVYQQIIALSENGLLLVGDIDESDVKKRLEGLDIKLVRIRPGGVDGNLVNAYMNLLQKSNIPINAPGSSSKTPLEQGIDLIRQTMGENGQ